MDTVIPTATPAYLSATLGSAQAPLLLDVRSSTAFEADTRMIAGATWRDPYAVENWQKYLPRHREVVVYCVRGHEISRNTTAALINAGIRARSLEGGIEGWKQASGATVLKQAEPAIPSGVNAPSIWVTRERPKIDRIACPWLIRRFIDPLAEFRYVPAAEVAEYAAQHKATAYDVPGVRFTHRNDRCSFDTLLDDFGLDDPALRDLAVIVRGADTDRHALAPQSAGLLAVSLGLSSLYRDDLDMLRQGMVVYDALYAWVRRARAERHDAKLFEAA